MNLTSTGKKASLTKTNSSSDTKRGNHVLNAAQESRKSKPEALPHTYALDARFRGIRIVAQSDEPSPPLY